MGKRKVDPATEERQAWNFGMPVEQWRHAKKQSETAKQRGKRGEAAKKLETWGPVDGQAELFPEPEKS